jgi:hypothetical protein
MLDASSSYADKPGKTCSDPASTCCRGGRQGVRACRGNLVRAEGRAHIPRFLPQRPYVPSCGAAGAPWNATRSTCGIAAGLGGPHGGLSQKEGARAGIQPWHCFGRQCLLLVWCWCAGLLPLGGKVAHKKKPGKDGREQGPRARGHFRTRRQNGVPGPFFCRPKIGHSRSEGHGRSNASILPSSRHTPKNAFESPWRPAVACVRGNYNPC